MYWSILKKKGTQKTILLTYILSTLIYSLMSNCLTSIFPSTSFLAFRFINSNVWLYFPCEKSYGFLKYNVSTAELILFSHLFSNLLLMPFLSERHHRYPTSFPSEKLRHLPYRLLFGNPPHSSMYHASPTVSVQLRLRLSLAWILLGRLSGSLYKSDHVILLLKTIQDGAFYIGMGTDKQIYGMQWSSETNPEK